jgi:hypothetical protein
MLTYGRAPKRPTGKRRIGLGRRFSVRPVTEQDYGVIVLVSGATAVVREHPEVGVLVVPAAGNAPEHIRGRIWAMDNGAFSGLDVPLFLRMLRAYRGWKDCLFVTAPDVVGDAEKTIEQFREWEPLIHSWGWPVAFVGQDGLKLSDVPWSSCEAVFLGGTTEWKLGRVARDLASYGNARGKWVHMGRVNSRRRLHYAMKIGSDSIDGTCFSRWSKVFLPKQREWINGFNRPLFDGVPVTYRRDRTRNPV